jgi:cytochrome c oxidase cbb3-type subunit 3
MASRLKYVPGDFPKSSIASSLFKRTALHALVIGLIAFQFLALTPMAAHAEDREDKEHYDPEMTMAEEFTSPADLSQGRQSIMAFCSRCHGLEGTGGKGPDLTTGQFRHGTSAQEVYDNIVNGIPGTGMPAFPVQGRHVWQIVNYLLSQAEKNKSAAVGSEGDQERGAKLFADHKCNECHWTGKSGGRRGVDLSRSFSPVDYLRKSILHPNEDIDIELRTVTAMLQDGRIVSGVRRFENGYYVLLIDDQERLRKIAKADIDEMEVAVISHMPDFKQVLSDKDVDDLVAYIISLRKQVPQ